MFAKIWEKIKSHDPDKVFLECITKSGVRRYTYNQFVTNVEVLGTHLIHQSLTGVGIYVNFENPFKELIGCFAIMYAGSTVVPGYYFSRKEEKEFKIIDPNITTMLCGDVNKARDIYKDLNLKTFINVDDVDPEIEIVECVKTSKDTPLLRIYTSGTTGEPKGIIFTVTNLFRFAEMDNPIKRKILELLPSNPDFRMLSYLPITSHWTMEANVVPAVWLGVTLVHVQPWTQLDLDFLIPILEDYKISYSIFEPWMIVDILDYYTEKNMRPYLQIALSSGVYPDGTRFNNIEKHLSYTHLYNIYGSIESGCLLIGEVSKIKTFNAFNSLFYYDDQEVKLLDNGELISKSKAFATQYVRNDKIFPLLKDGWLHTGDILTYDKNTKLYQFVNRKK